MAPWVCHFQEWEWNIKRHLNQIIAYMTPQSNSQAANFYASSDDISPCICHKCMINVPSHSHSSSAAACYKFIPFKFSAARAVRGTPGSAGRGTRGRGRRRLPSLKWRKLTENGRTPLARDVINYRVPTVTALGGRRRIPNILSEVIISTTHLARRRGSP